MNAVSLVELKANESQEILEFVFANHIKSPFFRSANFTRSYCEDMYKYYMGDLETTLELKASYGFREKSTSKLVALCINKIRGKVPCIKVDGVPEKFRRTFRFLALVDQAWLNTNDDTILEFGTVCVRPDYYGNGLATQLAKVTERRAVELQCDAVGVASSNVYLNSILRKLAFTEIYRIEFSKYVDETDGKKLFVQQIEPHFHWTVLYKKLEKISNH